ncbi:hypothetical protein [Candidatus Nanohalococcus occultus]|uniref:Uncharacterized protein n=1 Tax=Candidatus Nanohalococcus occultus TaxID=2978047 RepID=A0ABY8CIC7_9ARCH|nr:hypothetical protein SVXNc_0104 [Candidatus Nanohaloarchaeota archaeon SVXNc]
MDNQKILQMVVLLFGLFFAGSFAFGGIANYGNMISTPNSQNSGGSNQQPATLPSTNYQETGFNVSMEDRRNLARMNDVVFVSLLYNTSEQREQLQSLEGLEANFNGRVFIEVVNSSETTRFITLGEGTPRAVLISARQSAAVVSEPTSSNIASAACSSLINWGSTASYCTQYQ